MSPPRKAAESPEWIVVGWAPVIHIHIAQAKHARISERETGANPFTTQSLLLVVSFPLSRPSRIGLCYSGQAHF